jgi:hypothetical protein
VAQSLGIGLGTVAGVERRASAASLGWADIEGLTDEAIETRLYPPPEAQPARALGPGPIVSMTLEKRENLDRAVEGESRR